MVVVWGDRTIGKAGVDRGLRAFEVLGQGTHRAEQQDEGKQIAAHGIGFP
jgi:hypothetical protein